MDVKTGADDNNEQLQPLTSDDLEEVQLELNRFEKSPTTNIPSILERYLIFVAKNGNVNFTWGKIKPLFRAKLENVIVDFSSISQPEEIPPVPNVDVFNFAAIRNKVFEQLDAFAGIPFTVQRLAELLTAPRRHYARTDKFMRALEKNMLIVSTVEARANNNHDSNANTNSNNRSSFMVNGDHSNSNGTPTKKEVEPTVEAKPEMTNANETKSNAPSVADSIEDELDAEMPEITSNKSIEDEMISEAVVVEEVEAKKEVAEAEQSEQPQEMEAESRLNEPTSSSIDEAAGNSEAEGSNEAAASTSDETALSKSEEPPEKKAKADDDDNLVNSTADEEPVQPLPTSEAEASTLPTTAPETTTTLGEAAS